MAPRELHTQVNNKYPSAFDGRYLYEQRPRTPHVHPSNLCNTWFETSPGGNCTWPGSFDDSPEMNVSGYWKGRLFLGNTAPERARNPSPGFSSSIRTLQWCLCIWKYNRHASCKEFGRHSETACLHLSLIRALWKDMGKFGVLMSSKKLLLAKHVVKTLPIRHINFRFAVYERTWSCTEASPRVCMFGCTLVRAALSLLSSLNLWCCRCCCCYDCYFRLAFEYRKKT